MSKRIRIIIPVPLPPQAVENFSSQLAPELISPGFDVEFVGKVVGEGGIRTREGGAKVLPGYKTVGICSVGLGVDVERPVDLESYSGRAARRRAPVGVVPFDFG